MQRGKLQNIFQNISTNNNSCVFLGFCYVFRNGNQCAMKEGNPFGPFWDHFNVDFDNYVEHKGLLYETDFEPVKNDWILR